MKPERYSGTVSGPMFPRMHANDREKGGPKAPPRNKMALYEMFGVPLSLSSNQQHRRNGLIKSQLNQHSSGPSQLDANRPGIFQNGLEDSRERVVKIGDDDDDFVVPVHWGSTESQFNSGVDTEAKTEGPLRISSNFQATELQNCSGNNLKSTHPVKILTSSGPGQGGLKRHLSDDNSAETISDPLGTMMTDETKAEFKEWQCLGQQIHDGTVAQGCSDMPPTKDGDCESRFVDESEGGEKSILKPNPCFGFGMDAEIFRSGGEHCGMKIPPLETNMAGESNSSKTCVKRSFAGMNISPDDVVGLLGQKNFWKVRMTIASQQRAFALQVFELHRLIEVQKLFASTPHPFLQGHCTTPLGSSLLMKPPEPKPSAPLRGGRPVFSEGSACGVQPAESNPTKSLGQGDQPMYQWLVPVISPSEGLVYKPISGPYTPRALSPATLWIRPSRILPSDQSVGILPPFSRFPVPVVGPPSLARSEDDKSSQCTGDCNMPTVLACAGHGGIAMTQQSSPSELPKVIRVVPHGRRQASESAARIFEAIQEERKQGKN